MIESDPSDPPYRRIVAELRRRMASGELSPGARAPSTRQIMAEFGVAMATATKVLTTLRHEGLVHTQQGVGTTVAGREPRTRLARPRRTEGTEELTTRRVVACAMRIADLEGLGALSMRRVAADLDVPTMALYNCVENKDELVQLMAEAAFTETPPPSGALPAQWRPRLEIVCRTLWTIHRRHPWLVHAMSLTRPRPAPGAMAHTEWALRALDGLNLEPVTMLHIHIATFSYVRGFAINFELEAEAEQNTGITDDQWLRSQDMALAGMLASGAFPMLARATAEMGSDFSVDQIFEFGLNLVLDGIGAQIARRGEKRD